MNLREAAEQLRAAGIQSADFDAAELASFALGVPRSQVIDIDGNDLFDELIARRAKRVPLQHITGRVGFRHLELLVGPGVFVPRPETECVVGWCLKQLRGIEAPVVVDLGSGSGAIALSIAHEHRSAAVYAVEFDDGAFSWLQKNVVHTGLGVAAHRSALIDALPELDGTVDLVVSNPPYVPDDERELVEPEVRDYDPEIALWAGPDGLAVIRDVETAAHRMLRAGGWFAVEHSDRQGESVPDLLRAHGWLDVRDHIDLAGRDRFATARRP